jgi:large subunit ribosomal protein L10
MIKKKHIPSWKLEEVNQLLDLFKNYKNVAVIDVSKISDRQIQEMRKLLRGKAIFKLSKKNLQKLAIEQYKEESKKENLEELAEMIPGQAALCFTNLDVFELKNIFNENEWMVAAKPNEITPVDIIVPAGDTGLPTGQVISELNMTLRLPTRIQNDTIWVREDTRTHKKGDLVDVKQAAVLKKLGITPIESLILILFAWSEGEIISEDILYMNLEKFKEDITYAYLSAQNLALDLGIVDKETITPFTQKAHRQALALLFDIPIYIEELRNEYIKKATLNAQVVNSMILGETAQASAESVKSEKEEKEEEEEEEEVGIGGLFG